MNRLAICFASLFVSVSFALAQSSPQKDLASVSDPDRVQIDQTLQRYLAAYQHKSLPELTAVWPDLEKQKTEYGRIKHHFADASLSDEQMEVTPIEIRPTGDGVALRVHRTERFTKTETSTTSSVGDLRTQTLPTQDPGPYKKEKQHKVTKSGEVWITLRRDGDKWAIVSIGEQSPLPSPRPVT